MRSRRTPTSIHSAGCPTHRALCDEWDPTGDSAPRTAEDLAETFLRFQRVDGTETHREAPLHTPQPSAAGIGGKTRAVEVEQFPRLSLRRNRTGAHKLSRVAARNQASSASEFRRGRKPPHPQKTRMSGAPRKLVEAHVL